MKIEMAKRLKSGVIASLSSLIVSLIFALIIIGLNYFSQTLMLIFTVLAISSGLAFVVDYLGNSSFWLYSVIYGAIVSLLTVSVIVIRAVSNI